MPVLAASRKLNLNVQYAVCGEDDNNAAGTLPTTSQFRFWVRASLAGGGDITIRLAAEDDCRAINLRYRGIDRATNVLSFSYAASPRVEGDLLLCPVVVATEALEQGKALEAHYAHLVLHGVLHLQGWDHQEEASASAMEKREREILGKLGYDDPYA